MPLRLKRLEITIVDTKNYMIFLEYTLGLMHCVTANICLMPKLKIMSASSP